MALIQLIYVSTASEELPEDELDRILESSVRHNTPQEITGMLLYSRGTFMQVLEGEEEAIDETYGRLLKDLRHRDVYLIDRRPIQQREFQKWTMGFRRLGSDDAAASPAYAPFFTDGFDAGQMVAKGSVAFDILKHFSRN